MLFIVSPAKTLDYDTPLPIQEVSQPPFISQSSLLIDRLKELSNEELEALMKISPKLSELNSARYQEWSAQHAPSATCRQAVLAFKGDVYQGLDAYHWSEEDFQNGQQQLRILSGLYGVLRPLDLLHPYRLEMGTRLTVGEHRNLYQFWGSQVTEHLNKDLTESDNPALINLASNEYYSVVKPKEVQAPIITPDFKDWKNGKYKVISFYAKKARGMMVKWAIQNKVSSPEDLKGFDVAGYGYNAEMSSGNNWVFSRKLEE